MNEIIHKFIEIFGNKVSEEIYCEWKRTRTNSVRIFSAHTKKVQNMENCYKNFKEEIVSFLISINSIAEKEIDFVYEEKELTTFRTQKPCLGLIMKFAEIYNMSLKVYVVCLVAEKNAIKR